MTLIVVYHHLTHERWVCIYIASTNTRTGVVRALGYGSVAWKEDLSIG